ncbi:MAG: hypothetical protein LBN95_10480 [Prevotellaceae bacterium]|jgi:hypothetical protein|nr:hypothetical protein [Prevotellaceae bacterium]
MKVFNKNKAPQKFLGFCGAFLLVASPHFWLKAIYISAQSQSAAARWVLNGMA